MTVNIHNGKTRRTLAEQLDRLDGILGNLSGEMSETVAAAVKEGTRSAVQEAVREALLEVLTNPDVLTLLGSAAHAHIASSSPMEQGPEATEDRPSLRDRLGALGAWAGRRVRAVRSACGQAASAGRRCLGGLGARLVPLWRFRRQLLIALGIGATAGVIAYTAGPLVSIALTGLATFASTLMAQARLLWKRLAGEPTFASATT